MKHQDLAYRHSPGTDIENGISYQLAHPVIRYLSAAFRLMKSRSRMQHLGLLGMARCRGERKVASSGSICWDLLCANSRSGVGTKFPYGKRLAQQKYNVTFAVIGWNALRVRNVLVVSSPFDSRIENGFLQLQSNVVRDGVAQEVISDGRFSLT